MNFANALGFVGLGLAMCFLPVAAPGLFPHTAIDGSSTRALWVEVMGLVQFGLGFVSLIRGRSATATQPDAAAGDTVPAAADSLGDYAPEPTLAVDFAGAAISAALRARGAEPVGSITLHGEPAALWRAFDEALRRDGHLGHLARRVVSLARADAQGTEPAPENVVPFPFAAETRELAEESKAA